MKITDLNVTLFSGGRLPSIRYSPNNPSLSGESCLGLVTISTDEGLEGHAFLGSPPRGAQLDARSLIDALKPIVMGRDPLQREALYEALCKRRRMTTWRAIGAVDVALWDLAGKIANLPVYRLIGGFRDSIPAYASSPAHASPEAFVDEALATKERGLRGYKIHPPTRWRDDIRTCELVRKAVGDDYVLMLDSTWAYSYDQALRVGQAIEALGFYWYEDPLHEDDIYNYVELKRHLSIPIMATEYTPGSFRGYASWLSARATDYLRGDVAVKGGITACLRGAHIAEGFGLSYELHHGGNALNNVANLHVTCAIPNTEMYEFLLPDSAQKQGLLEYPEADADGMVHAPIRPGLGAQIDFDRIRATTLAVVG